MKALPRAAGRLGATSLASSTQLESYDVARTNRSDFACLTSPAAGRVTTRPLRVRHSRGPPRTLTEEQLLTLVEACEHLRDRFLLVLLAESAMFSRGRPWGRGLCSGCSRCSEAC